MTDAEYAECAWSALACSVSFLACAAERLRARDTARARAWLALVPGELRWVRAMIARDAASYMPIANVR